MKNKEALFYIKIDQTKIRCILCNHFCILADGQTGVCGARKNNEGVLFALNYGNIIAKNVDPIEKKPLYHVLPNSKTYSIAAPGCNFHCDFCQNWQISQIKEWNAEKMSQENSFSAEQIVHDAITTSCKSIAFTYTEPTVYYEVMKEIATIALNKKLRLLMVSNGYMSADCLIECNQFIDAYNIDLKSFSDNFYMKRCGGRLKPVLDTITSIVNNNKMIEITTLIIPEENDSPEELDAIAAFISELDREIPWHVSRFFPNYRLTNHTVTDEKILIRAVEAGKKHGLKYIYTGNTQGEKNTFCPVCGIAIIKRKQFGISESIITEQNICPKCNTKIHGIWR